MAKFTIETFDLSKTYKLKGKHREIIALNNVNLSIKKGETFGLLGPNGAGKTTMIHILTTIKQPTSGYATIDGYNIVKQPDLAKGKIGLMLDNKMIYYRISGYDNLKFFCKIYKVPVNKKRIYEIADEFGLKEWLNQHVEYYSSGMKMKLALLRTLLINRQILFLDEPTLGLDVKTISFIVDKIRELDSTIFLTSHDMSVIEKLCDRIAFINNGEIVKVGTKEDISRAMQQEIRIEISLNEKKEQLKKDLFRQSFVTNITDTKYGFIVNLKSRNFYQELLINIDKYKILKVKELELSLGDLFIKLV